MPEGEQSIRRKIFEVGMTATVGGLAVWGGAEVFSYLTHDVVPVVNETVAHIGKTAAAGGVLTSLGSLYYGTPKPEGA